jgi:hypothetical protein
MNGVERRVAERFRVNLEAHWESLTVQREGTISDISMSGCFMLTSGDVSPEETVSIEIKLHNQSKIDLRGEVVYLIPEMGFAVRFIEFTEDEKLALEQLINAAR